MTSGASLARKAGSWVEALARLGFFVKGVVYATIGFLAASLAISGSGSTNDPQGALRKLGASRFGHASLALIAVGLLAYAVWRLIAAMMATDDDQPGAWGLLGRLGKTIDGVLHALLGMEAARLFAATAGPEQDVAQTWSAKAMRIPGGRWLVIAVGVGMAVYAVYQLYRQFTHGSRDHLRSRRTSERTIATIDMLGRYGTSSMSVVVVLIGLFFVRTAIAYDPKRAGGIGYSLATLANEKHGRLLLAIVSLGFVSFGAFQMASAKYRRVRVMDHRARPRMA